MLWLLIFFICTIIKITTMSLDLSKLSILVVDDVKAMRLIVMRVLKTLGVGILYEAEDGNKAYQLYCEKRPDMIITDWHMDPVTGIDLVRKIRRSADEFNPAIPIIMMTGYNDLSRISEARDCGITEFIVKPFSAEDIAKRITHTIKNPRDFIRGNDYVGPDRRRRVNEKQASKKRRKEDRYRIPASNDLQMKVGIGALNPKIIQKSQEVINNNDIDFRPMAGSLLTQLDEAIKDYKAGERPLEDVGNEIIEIVMQIKGNAGVFHY